jgi:transposase-like protein
MDLMEIVTDFGTQRKCIDHLEKIRWPEGPECPYCQSKKFSTKKIELRYRCKSCSNSYSVLVGTIFHASKLPLPKWFAAIALIKDAKKGISSLQLARHLKVNKNTSWYLQSRIRQAMKEDLFFDGTIEIDEVFIGGSTTNMHESYLAKHEIKRDGKEHKMTVLGMLERKGQIALRVIPKANKEHIRPILRERISSRSTLITDGHGSYVSLHKEFDKHVSLNHAKRQHKKGEFNLSSIEGFWALLKRAVIGVYHSLSLRHLQSYVDEIAFKYNKRYEPDSFNTIVSNLLTRRNATC